MQDIEQFLGEFGLAVPQEQAEAFRERFAAGWQAADSGEPRAETPPESGGRVRFTEPMADSGAGMTREQIMAIPDRRRRRAAIAQNLNLFEKEN